MSEVQPCGHRTRHTTRIGCCAGCKRLFSSDSAFARHRRKLACVDPAKVGLIPVPSPSHPSEAVWSHAGSRPVSAGADESQTNGASAYSR